MSYDIDAEKMLQVLRIGREKISDKGIASAVKRVDPLKSQAKMGREEIIAAMIDTFTRRYGAVPGSWTNRRAKPLATWPHRSSPPRSGPPGCRNGPDLPRSHPCERTKAVPATPGQSCTSHRQ